MGNDLLNNLAAIAGIGLALITTPGTIELLILTLWGLAPRKSGVAKQLSNLHPFRMAIVAPAHNEAAGIERSVRSLLACEPVEGGYSVVVVADNCTDDTAALARKAGARVLVRQDDERRGKGYALDFAFDVLLAEGVDAVIIVDADTIVEPHFVTEFERLFRAGAEAVQCRYLVNNVQDSIRTRLMNIALSAFNVLRPRGRDRLGVSAGLFGNGFGLSARTLLRVPYTAVSVVEDLEYHLRLVRAGIRVVFADAVTVKADMPTGGAGARTQRARWEGGRFRMAMNSVPTLVKDVLHGRLRMIEPLLDLLLPPLAFYLLLVLATLAIPYTPTRIYAICALGVTAFHVAAAIYVGGGGVRELTALAAAPFYVLWKAMLIPQLLRTARKDAAWVRTERSAPAGPGPAGPGKQVSSGEAKP
jgi:cellulose synthase/poly-beta-1,6-N-acetylglucosamine synthase-like glycosyltransferase